MPTRDVGLHQQNIVLVPRTAEGMKAPAQEAMLHEGRMIQGQLQPHCITYGRYQSIGAGGLHGQRGKQLPALIPVLCLGGVPLPRSSSMTETRDRGG